VVGLREVVRESPGGGDYLCSSFHMAPTTSPSETRPHSEHRTNRSPNPTNPSQQRTMTPRGRQEGPVAPAAAAVAAAGPPLLIGVPPLMPADRAAVTASVTPGVAVPGMNDGDTSGRMWMDVDGRGLNKGLGVQGRDTREHQGLKREQHRFNPPSLTPPPPHPAQNQAHPPAEPPCSKLCDSAAAEPWPASAPRAASPPPPMTPGAWRVESASSLWVVRAQGSLTSVPAGWRSLCFVSFC